MIRLFLLALLLGLQQAKEVDSLPKGALARCGGAGFRHDGIIVSSVIFSEDGRMIASSGDDQDPTLRVWDAASGRELRRLSSGRAIVCIGFSADGKSVISSGDDGVLRFWDISTGRGLRNLEARGLPMLTHDGKVIASVEQGHPIRLVEAETGRELRKIEAAPLVRSLAFSPDGKALAAPCMDRSAGGAKGLSIRVWEAASGKELWRSEGEKAMAVSAQFSPDGKVLATGGDWDPTVRLWDAATGKLIREIEIPKMGDVASTPGLAFSPDGKILATGDSLGWLRFWDPSTGREIRGVKSDTGWLASLSFSPNGKLLAAAGHGRSIRLIEVATGKDGRKAGNDEAVYSLVFSADGKAILTGSNQIRRWNSATGMEIPEPVSRGDPDRISLEPTLLGLSSDGKTLASGCYTTVKTWDAVSGRARAAVKFEFQRAIQSLAVSPDGKHVAIGTTFNTLQILDALTGAVQQTLQGAQRGVDCLAYSPDGKWLATGSSDNTIVLWEVAGGRRASTLAGHAKKVTSVAFLPDGKLLASGSEDHTLRLWDVASGTETRAFQGESPIRTLAIPPGGSTIASGGDDRMVHIWDVRSGKETGKLSGHEGAVLCLRFSPDGKMLASGSADMSTLIWNVPP